MDTTYNNYVSLKYVNFSNVETHEYMINVLNGKRNKCLIFLI